MKLSLKEFIRLLNFASVFLYSCHHAVLLRPQSSEYVTVTRDKYTGENIATVINNNIILTLRGPLIYSEKSIVVQQLWFEIKNQSDIDILFNPQKIYIKSCKNEYINLPVLSDGVYKIKPIYLSKGKKFGGILSVVNKEFECESAEIIFEEIKDIITEEKFKFSIFYRKDKKE